jgi:hypothetical protein
MTGVRSVPFWLPGVIAALKAGERKRIANMRGTMDEPRKFPLPKFRYPQRARNLGPRQMPPRAEKAQDPRNRIRKPAPPRAGSSPRPIQTVERRTNFHRKHPRPPSETIEVVPEFRTSG